MSISITLYQVSKQLISTYKPADRFIYKTVTGDFVEECSFLEPTVILSREENQNITRFNYASITWPADTAYAKTRYYWVTKKTIMPDGRLRIEMNEDMLATWKDAILNTTQFIERASSLYDCDNIVDTTIPVYDFPKTIFAYQPTTGGVLDVTNVIYNDDYCWYIVGISAREVSAASAPVSSPHYMFRRGSISYYGFSKTQFYDLIKAVKNEMGATYKISDFIVSAYCTRIDTRPFEWLSHNVNSIHFEVASSTSGVPTSVVTINNYVMPDLYSTTTAAGKDIISIVDGVLKLRVYGRVINPIYDSMKSAMDNYGRQIGLKPFTQVYYADPKLGLLELDKFRYFNDNFNYTNGVFYHAVYTIDLATGYTILTSRYSSKTLCGTISVPMDVTSLSNESTLQRNLAWTQYTTSTFSQAGAVASKTMMGDIPGVASGIMNILASPANMIGHVIEANRVIPSSAGSNGSFNGVTPGVDIGDYPNDYAVGLIIVFHEPIEDNDNMFIIPRLVQKVVKLSDVPEHTYIICKNARLIHSISTHSVPITRTTGMLPIEQQTICQQLNAGLYIE